MSKHVALLTAGHLSSCPRLLKEAELLSKYGYEISIVYLNSISSVGDLDKTIIDKHLDWKFYEIKWNNSVQSILSKLIYKMSIWFEWRNRYLQSTSKALIDKTLSIKADLYIAHHPSVLAAAALAAKKFNAKYGYDIEDAFPFLEEGGFWNNPDKRISDIEREYIEDASYLSTASPLYTEVYTKLYSLKYQPIDLLNVFDIDESPIEYKDRKDLKKISFYWYSQTIGLNRGLQDLFLAINSLPEDSFELHLRGMYAENVKEILMNLVVSRAHQSNIFFHSKVSIVELDKRNKEHDLGFALEASTSLNRELCISNKILDYLRSGLMIVATDTKGHEVITNQLGEFAINYKQGDVESLASQLTNLINNPSRIYLAKAKSMELARAKYNWSKQSQAWLKKVKEVLS